MNTEYVIVIEVDNKRAHAAYLKGLADLDVVWPQIMAYATEGDKEAEEKRLAKEAKDKEERARQDVVRDEYDAKLQAYREWSPSFFGGPRPPVPHLPFELFMNRSSLMSVFQCSAVDTYQSIRRELQDMANLSGAATGPYRMTERKVREMIQWEDGSRVEWIMQAVKPSSFPASIDTAQQTA